MKHAFAQDDVFTDTPLQGNPLGVACIDGRFKFWDSAERLLFALARSFALMSPRRVSARHPSNFGVPITSLREVSGPPLREHLRAQMKVTKAKGLNTI